MEIFQNGLNNLDYVYITGVTGVSNLNGYWRVNKINATTYDLIGSSFTSGAILTSNNVLYDQGKLKLGTGYYLGYSGCSNPCVPLPIKLLYFSITKVESINKITWEINDIENTSYYVIEKSNDALNFTKVDSVNSINTRSINNYSIYDNRPYVSTTYYRIKSQYNNGSFDYSIIRYSENDTNELVVYPNPSNDVFYVSYNNITDMRFSISDINGNIVSDYTTEKNYNYFKVFNLPKGVYIINLYTDTELLHYKIIRL